MSSIYLDVPFVTQLGFGDASKPQDDPTGCWYSSACMVGYYFGAGPRFGVPELFTPGSGHAVIDDAHTERFLKRENLTAVSEPATNKWTVALLHDTLRSYGPLVVSWVKTHGGNTYGHCSVVIGVDGWKKEVVIHDPENAPNTRQKLADFNATFMWGFGWGLLRKNVPAFQQRTIPQTGGFFRRFFGR